MTLKSDWSLIFLVKEDFNHQVKASHCKTKSKRKKICENKNNVITRVKYKHTRE